MIAPAATDTIFARASGAGRAGIAVFRVSGPQARAIAELLSKRRVKPRRPTLAALVDPESGEEIDRGLVLLFEGPASFTGEDVAEFHLHGSRAVEAAFAEAAARAGARPAEAGEFTRRALLNGKLDLAQVEALADLIDAETSQQRKQALGQFEGRLSALAEGWRGRLIAVLAPLEADIDFPGEEDIPAAIAARAGPAIEALIAELKSYLEGAGRARRLREGVTAAIIGAPNSGKSSLLNALAGADVAIVSALAGTTRDVIETRLDLGGIPVLFADTAGLRDQSTDEIEIEGVRRALRRAGTADLRIMVIDPFTEEWESGFGTRDPGLGRQTSRVPSPESRFPLLRPGDIVVWSKKDLGGAPRAVPVGVHAFHVSAKTGEGMAGLMAGLEARAADLAGGSEGAALTRIRHAEAVTRAVSALERALARVASDPELAAEDARLAARALGQITGAVDVEDVLDAIFSSFCIGK
jgi:tRNA modification GTPase